MFAARLSFLTSSLAALRPVLATRAALFSVSLMAGPMASAETLQEALAAAYRHNPQLMAERARVREVDESYVQAQAQNRFTAASEASLGGTVTDYATFGRSFTDNFIPRSFAITGQKPLYQGGRVRSLKGQAKYGILAARENLRSAEQSVLLSAATAYAEVLQNEQVASIRRNNVRVLARQTEAATERFKVGAGTRTDVAQADARLAGAQAGLAAADASLAQSRAAYFRATGHMPEPLEPIPTYSVPPTLDAAVTMALSYNPQLEAARYAQDAAKFGIDVAKAAYGPTLSLQTFAQTSADQGSSVTSQSAIGLSANLTIPLITGGMNASQVRAAKAAQMARAYEARNAEMAMREQVTGLWAQLDSARRSLSSIQRQIDAANVAFEGVEIEREVGTRSALDTLNAEQEVLNAKLSYAQAQKNIDVLVFQLLTLTGAFDAASLQLPVEFYDPKNNFDAVTTLSPLAPLKQRIKALSSKIP